MRKASFFSLILLSLFVASSVYAGQLEDGLAAYERGEYESAATLLRPLAEQGNADAQFNLGAMYLNGQGVPQDGSEAVKWYREAAEQGNVDAQSWLGNLYFLGMGIVPQDNEEAVKWYRKAAEQGDADAQFDLGFLYFSGWGVPEDNAEAVKWFLKAAEQGNVDAQSQLGLCYFYGWGIPEDKEEAAKWYRQAAEQDNVDAQFKLGGMYATGRGVQQDYPEAEKWWRKAAEQGNANAQYFLGSMYDTDGGVLKNQAEALKWYRKAAEQGNVDAQFSLGLIYHNGRGVPEDDEEAVRWYRKAAEQGDAKAQFNLGATYANGRGVLKSISAAVDWYYEAGISFLKDGQRENALTALDRINSNSPGHWLGKKLQQKIYSRNGGTSEEFSSDSEETELKESISQGTGWFVAPGIVVSNFHVLEDKSTFLVILPGGKEFPASLFTRDQANDIVLLKVNAPASILPKAFPIARSPAKVGSKVFTIGYPHPDVMGMEPKLTSGDVNSGKGLQDDPRFYQISVPVQAGNSGGPLLNLSGEVVGIVTSKLQAVGMAALTGDLTQNVNYALKSHYLLPLLDERMDRSPGNLLPNNTAPLEELVIRTKSSVVMILAK